MYDITKARTVTLQKITDLPSQEITSLFVIYSQIK